jgi:predicted amidohydrolase
MASFAVTPGLQSATGTNFVLALAHFPEHEASFTSRLDMLRQLMSDCSQCIGEKKDQIDADLPFRGMVVCPEYFFADFVSSRREPLNEQQKDLVQAYLLKLSADYPKILLIPGTIFYAKNVVRPQEAARKMIKSGKHAGERTGELKTADRQEKAVRAMHTALSMGASSSNDWVRDTTTSDKVLGGKQVLSMNDKYRALRDGKATTYCRNRSYLLLGGAQIGRYDKQTDFRESTANVPDEMIFIPGTQNQIPEVAGFKFGIEICFDHGNGVLKNRGVPVHFQIVVSDWVNTHTSNCSLVPGGYFIHASTNSGETKLYWNATTGVTDLTDTNNYKVRIRHAKSGDKEIRFFLLSLPGPVVVAKKKSLLGKMFS